MTIEVIDPGEDDAQRCLRAYEAELNERFDAGFVVDAALPLPADELRAPAGCFVVAYHDGEAIGCGGLKLHGTDPAEIKRVWVDRSARGLGLARRLLTELEDRARAAGAPAVQLDTNRTLTEAIALYRKTGYVEIEAFNDEPYAHHWFQKDLRARPVMNVRRLEPRDVDLVASIDRSEHVEVQYRVNDGRLVEAPVSMADIPTWDPDGSGEHSVASHITFCASVVADGGVLLGAFNEDGELMGLATVHPTFEPGLAWLATLHVSRTHRRRGAASALWDAGIALARDAGARALYVSATSTGSAVGFYLGRGCRLADPVHAELFAHEPEDIHLVCPL